MSAKEFIEKKNLNLKITINGAVVPVKCLEDDMYALMEEYAQEEAKELFIRIQGMKILCRQKVKEAYTDGFLDSKFDFDEENYSNGIS